METNIDRSVGTIVKSDQTGRIRYTPEYKREVLAAFESSNLSAPEVFAKQCAIKDPTLAAWIGARKRGDQTAPRGNSPAFLVAEVASSANGPALEVQLPGGSVARVSSSGQVRPLAKLLRHLA
jgi:transposase-like protein